MASTLMCRLVLMCFALGAGTALVLVGVPLSAPTAEATNPPVIKAKSAAPNGPLEARGDEFGKGGLPAVQNGQRIPGVSVVSGRCLRGGMILSAATPGACQNAGGAWTTKRAGLTGVPAGPVDSQRNLRRSAPAH